MNYMHLLKRKGSSSLLGLEFLRYTKPRWLPTAKSKIFRVPPRPVIPKEDYEELKRLYNRYRTYMRSIRLHFKEKYVLCSDSFEIETAGAEQELAEHRELMEYNKRENERVAQLREERLQKERAMMFEEAEHALIERKEQLNKNREEAIKKIRETQALVKTFIKREDLIAAIEKAIANPVEFEYAIDEEGCLYKGRNTKPSDVNTEVLERLQPTTLGGYIFQSKESGADSDVK